MVNRIAFVCSCSKHIQVYFDALDGIKADARQKRYSLELAIFADDLEFECKKFAELKSVYPSVWKEINEVIYLIKWRFENSDKKVLNKINRIVEGMADAIFKELAELEKHIVVIDNDDLT